MLRAMKRLLRLQSEPPSIISQYVTSAPSEQNALDIFAGEWVSKFPEPLASLRAGLMPAFEAPIVETWIARLGGLSGWNVLELGPLEAGHTYLLEKRGAASIDAIEANTRMYLRCLIVKEVLGLTRTRFLCGDFVEYLRDCPKQYDLVVASGVLYHMRDPLGLLAQIAQVTDRLCLWTHYYDPAIIESSPELKRKFSKQVMYEDHGVHVTLHRQEYGQALTRGWRTYYGGNADHSHWMQRDELLACLRHLGFTDIQITLEQPDHPNGPAFALLALRPGRR